MYKDTVNVKLSCKITALCGNTQVALSLSLSLYIYIYIYAIYVQGDSKL
jgi:hypothetical protein